MSDVLDNARAALAGSERDPAGYRTHTATRKALRDLIAEHERLIAPPADDEREALAVVAGAKEAYLDAYPGDDHAARFIALDGLAARRQGPVTVTEEMVERAARASFELPNGDGDCTWAEMVRDDPGRADIWREDARAAIVAALSPDGNTDQQNRNEE
jgi:hypothetical protein